ncbi:MAG: hypothetical protein V7K27_21910 [Nostoc sp.]|uniref:hypothetical protein n=1 Tax=Nostoc sp. TaxID=1180 RepID=UPI002FF6193B
MFGAYILGRSWVSPAIISTRNRRQGYVRGLQQLGWLSLTALPLFIVGVGGVLDPLPGSSSDPMVVVASATIDEQSYVSRR